MLLVLAWLLLGSVLIRGAREGLLPAADGDTEVAWTWSRPVEELLQEEAKDTVGVLDAEGGRGWSSFFFLVICLSNVV